MSTLKHTQPLHSRGWTAAKQSIISANLWLKLVSAIAVTAIAPITFLSSAVQAEVVADWKLNPETGTVEVLLPEGIIPQLSVLTQPGRFVLDLPQTEVGVNVTEFYEDSLVRQVSLTQVENQTARLTVDFSPGVALDAEEVELQQIGIDNLWIVRPRVQAFREPQITPEANVIPSVETIEPPAPPEITLLDTPVDPYPTTNGGVDILRIPLAEPTDTELFPEETMPPSAEVVEEVVITEEIIEQSVTSTALPGSRVIPYGQPIPKASEQDEIAFRPQIINQSPPSLLLAAGDTITLRYPSPIEVPLTARPDRQEVLLLQGGIVDREGQYIVPPDTPVIGRFETSSKGSRFIAVGIDLDDRTIPFAAQSEWIEGDLEIDAERVAIDSGIGGLGGLLVSGFSGIGLLVGALGGAAVGIITSPEPTTLLPGQIIEVQLQADLPKSELVYYGIDQAPPFRPSPYLD
ncbi:MAG: AMIN domain-containing protein [Microcoleaceae cyanobacterium]